MRVLNGFAASIDTERALRDRARPRRGRRLPGACRLPGRARRGRRLCCRRAPLRRRASPASTAPGVTVALLDTGVDFDHPFIREALLPGIDVLDPGGLAEPAESPTEAGRLERHGTELAGLVVGLDGPGDLHGVAPRRRCARSASRAGSPMRRVTSRSTRAPTRCSRGSRLRSIPNHDGDAHDAARVALVGRRRAVRVVRRRAARAGGGRCARSGHARRRPVRQRRPRRAGLRQRRCARGRRRRARCRRGGYAPEKPDCARPSPDRARRAARGRAAARWSGRPRADDDRAGVALSAPRVAVVGGQAGFERLFDERGFSRVAGTAPLLPPGPPTPEAVQELAAAGARAVLVDGPLPAGALGIDEPLEVPVLGLASGRRPAGAGAARCRSAGRARRRRDVLRREPERLRRRRRSPRRGSRSQTAPSRS